MHNTMYELNDAEIDTVSGGASVLDTLPGDTEIKVSIQQAAGSVLEGLNGVFKSVFGIAY